MMSCTECVVQLPANGVLNYTTVNVPVNKELFFKRNLLNTPVYLLAQGAVTIAGRIDLTGSQYEPGPGGFAGGSWAPYSPVLPGFGPGAGPQLDGNPNGKWVGPLSLVPLIGGSGGAGGGCADSPNYGAHGGGGGGAVVIASSTSVMITGGTIAANGGSFGFSPGCGPASWGFGSGGSIRVMGNTVTVTGSLQASGGCNFSGSCYPPFPGVIRLEAPAGALSFTGSAAPAAVLSTINPVILPSAPSSLSITSVGGYPVPSYAGQRVDTVDLLLPTQLPDPINVVVAASNIPVGTPVQINFGTTNAGTVTPGTLTGTLSSSSATVQVSGLNRTQLAYLFVSATVAVPQGAALFNPSGREHVAQVRITAEPGAAPQFAFLRDDGSAIDSARLPSEFLAQFQP